MTVVHGWVQKPGGCAIVRCVQLRHSCDLRQPARSVVPLAGATRHTQRVLLGSSDMLPGAGLVGPTDSTRHQVGVVVLVCTFQVLIKRPWPPHCIILKPWLGVFVPPYSSPASSSYRLPAHHRVRSDPQTQQHSCSPFSLCLGGQASRAWRKSYLLASGVAHEGSTEVVVVDAARLVLAHARHGVLQLAARQHHAQRSAASQEVLRGDWGVGCEGRQGVSRRSRLLPAAPTTANMGLIMCLQSPAAASPPATARPPNSTPRPRPALSSCPTFSAR